MTVFLTLAFAWLYVFGAIMTYAHATECLRSQMTPKEYVIILTWAFSIPALMIRELINQVRA